MELHVVPLYATERWVRWHWVPDNVFLFCTGASSLIIRATVNPFQVDGFRISNSEGESIDVRFYNLSDCPIQGIFEIFGVCELQ